MPSAEITSYKPTFCIESAQSRRARVRALPTRVSDTALRLFCNEIMDRGLRERSRTACRQLEQKLPLPCGSVYPHQL